MRRRAADVRAWARAALEGGGHAPPLLRAQALAVAGGLDRLVGDLPAAAARLEEALALCDGGEDLRLTAQVLNDLGVVAHIRGDYDRAAALAARSLVLLRLLNEPSVRPAMRG
jgi:ATP/maltotriose-dependent transcriptional regulator MalT